MKQIKSFLLIFGVFAILGIFMPDIFIFGKNKILSIIGTSLIYYGISLIVSTIIFIPLILFFRKISQKSKTAVFAFVMSPIYAIIALICSMATIKAISIFSPAFTYSGNVLILFIVSTIFCFVHEKDRQV